MDKKSFWKRMLSLFLVFLKIGAFTFGGGYAMIPVIKESIIEKKKWMDEDEMVDMIAIAESTPGPIAINIATYVGFKVGRYIGAAISTIAVSLPSLLIIYVISLFFDAFLSNRYVAYAFVGVKDAVALLICIAGIDMFRKRKKEVVPVLVFVSVLAAMILFEVFSINFSSIWIILMGGFLGLLMTFISSRGDKGKRPFYQVQGKRFPCNKSPLKDKGESL